MFDNTIDFINKFESLVGSESPTPNEKYFIYSYEIEIAKTLIRDLGDKSARRIGNILVVAATDN